MNDVQLRREAELWISKNLWWIERDIARSMMYTPYDPTNNIKEVLIKIYTEAKSANNEEVEKVDVDEVKDEMVAMMLSGLR